MSEPKHCSFCGKDQDQVKLIAGPAAFICDECVEICVSIISDRRAKIEAASEAAEMAADVDVYDKAMADIKANRDYLLPDNADRFNRIEARLEALEQCFIHMREKSE